MNLDNVEDAITIADMTDGHGHIMRTHAANNASGGERFWSKFIEALEKCTPIVNCVKKNQQKMTTTVKDVKKSDKTKRTRQEDDDCDGGDGESQKHDSQPNPEMVMVRWKTAETLVGSLGDDDDDDDDDNGSTAGD